MHEFYIKVMVSTTNLASQRVAEKLISTKPKACTESLSGEPALKYLRSVSKGTRH